MVIVTHKWRDGGKGDRPRLRAEPSADHGFTASYRFLCAARQEPRRIELLTQKSQGEFAREALTISFNEVFRLM
jgi:hypothetical protein